MTRSLIDPRLCQQLFATAALTPSPRSTGLVAILNSFVTTAFKPELQHGVSSLAAGSAITHPDTAVHLPLLHHLASCNPSSCWPAQWLHAPLRHLAAAASHHRYTDDYDKHHRVNTSIFSRALRVQLPDGQFKDMNRKDALKAAAEHNLDLVEFKAPSHGAKPSAGQELPLAKILNYKELRAERKSALSEHVQAIKHHSNQETIAKANASEQHNDSQGDEKEEESKNKLAAAAAELKSLSMEGQAPKAFIAAIENAKKTGTQKQAAPQEAQGVKRQLQTNEDEHSSNRPKRQKAQENQTGAQQLPPGQKQGQKTATAKKTKEMMFSPHIAQHDIQVRLKKIRAMLASGSSVSVSQEVDATGSTSAAERALETYCKQLADVGVPRGRKDVRKTMVSVLLNPLPASTTPGHKKQ